MTASVALAVASNLVPAASAAPIADAIGDAACVLTAGNPCAVPYDITQIEAFSNGTYITFRANLAQPIVRVPSDDETGLAEEQLGGYIDIDVDQDINTGTFAWGDYFAGVDPSMSFSGLGIEFYLDLYSEYQHPGTVELWDGAGATLISDLIPITYGPDWFSIVVPLALLGNDDGLVNFDVVVGDGVGLTDQAVEYQIVQGGGSPGFSVIAEPAPVALFGLVLTAIGLTRRRPPSRHA